MANISKRQKANIAKVDRTKVYSATEAIDLVKQTANTKFKGTVEVHVRLGIDPKKTDQGVRGSISLPFGTGKIKRVAAFVTEVKEKEAKEAGAALVGGADLIKQIKETEKTDFDMAVAEPAMMKLMGPIAKILGQRGLMPNPKTGTVTENIAGIIKEINAGKIDFKNDDSGNVHQIIGKTDFDSEKLVANLKTFIDALNASKPSTVKKVFITNIVVNASMGPGIKVKI
ncbi:MAG: 50S ribosomal protein L1 [Candidatus Doudnabacteria bacterium]